ncbi:MAG: hypothetical protein U9N34_05520 [Candidatus Cloacimonadota bacterium]|nr:hypothetical protein [Candidatus Cloacimonadota bacterium]
MKKIVLITVIVMLIATLNAGRYAGDFLSIGSGIKALGLGGAFTSIADDGSAIYWNASGIGQIKKSQAFLMRASLYENLATYDFASFCQPLPNDVTIGVSWTRLSIQDIPEFSESHLVGTNVDQRSSNLHLHLPGQPDGTFDSYDDLLQFAFAKHIHHKINMGWLFFKLPVDFYFGGSIKYVKRQVYGFMGSGTGFDLSFLVDTSLGALVDVNWLGHIRSGLNFQNIGGTTVTWDLQSNHSDEILLNTKFGLSLVQPISPLNSQIIFSFDKDYVYGGQDHYGFEYQYNSNVFVRTGYYDENISAGASYKFMNFLIDYGFVTNALGYTNRVGLQLEF